MTITSSGPLCDICGKYILLTAYRDFTVTHIVDTMHGHIECTEELEKWTIEVGDIRDLLEFPDGPLKDVLSDLVLTTPLEEMERKVE